jgi:hypothetical protein
MKKNQLNNRIIVASFISLLALVSCGKNKADSCNGEGVRRDIKIAIDDLADSINLSPITISVEEFGALEVPEAEKKSPRQEVELQVYTITGTVHKLSRHRDGDWKVKLTNGNDKYVNCESPNPGCPHVSGSLFESEYISARNWLVENEEDLVGKTVTITGVGFIDIDHKYPRNAADNEMELHPILDIHY